MTVLSCSNFGASELIFSVPIVTRLTFLILISFRTSSAEASEPKISPIPDVSARFLSEVQGIPKAGQKQLITNLSYQTFSNPQCMKY